MKRLCAVLLTLALLLGLCTVMATNTQAASIVAKGIDVSYWQGNAINWNAVAADSHGEFAILRAYCYGKDQYFDVNYTNAKAAGVPIGAYCYIYGTTVDDVKAEINGLLSVIKGKKFEYPIYVDVEDTKAYPGLGRQTVTDLVKTACQMLEAEGYFTGVYTYTNFANNYIYMDQLTNYTTWIAEYSSSCHYTGAYAMWQYGCEGSVGGINPVDVNYSYTDFPTIIKKAGLNGYVAPPDDTGVVAKGIDVSKWQMPMDWSKVAANEDVDFAMIRCTWNGLETTEWSTFYPQAKAAGVPIGCYAYTMATTVEEAREEAGKTVELLKGKQFEYPIFIDAEETGIYDKMDKATLTAIVKAECEVLKAAGYMPGVYANTNYATNHLDMSQLSQYPLWIADHRGYVGYTGQYDMWQWSCEGEMDGITGLVDLNYCYTDFPTMIKAAGLNGYEKEQIPEPIVDPNVEAYFQIKEQLPEVALLELAHADKVKELKNAYDAIPDAQKALLPAEEGEYVTAAVEKIAQLEYVANLGDVDQDGKVGAKDALEVLKYAVGKTLLNEKQQDAAEVDGKEGIDAKDALEILKFSVEKITQFPIVE